MTEKKKKGDFGEEKACLYLINKGYNITARNFRSKAGEIDIIAENSERLAFAEVKTRKLMGMGRPSDAVDYKKKNKIIKTAQIYLAFNETEKLVGFDIIEVTVTDSTNPDVIEINHFEDAFDASGTKGKQVLFI
ncbi:MAG: YraN family protein [Oscillospiraceae bacterium]|jgi:putative endonuclease|nr:YraN family protein [Oscillospiraceae bacterium]